MQQIIADGEILTDDPKMVINNRKLSTIEWCKSEDEGRGPFRRFSKIGFF